MCLLNNEVISPIAEILFPASIIAVSVIDLITTIYCIPVYLFLTISHCRNLGKK